MSTLRQQFLRNLSVTLGAAATTLIDVQGPLSPLETPYAENTDHVIRDRQVRSNEAGYVLVELAAVLKVAGVTYDVEIWSQPASSAQRGLEAPLFPSGAPAGGGAQSLQRVVATGLLGNDPALESVLGGASLAPADKDVPLLHLRADEFVRLRAANAGGAIGPAAVVAKFDLGIHPGDTMRLA